MLASLVLAAGLTAGVSGCAQATTTSESPTSIAPSDLERIASGNTSPAGASSDAASSTSGASGSGQFVVPEAAKAHTKEGAVAFVKFYWNMLEKLSVRPQTGVIPKFSSPECGACSAQEQKAAELAAEGSHVESSGARLTDFQVKPESVNDSVIVTFNQRKSSRVKIDRGGSKHALSDINWHVAARADWVNGEWKLGMSGADEL